MKRSNSPNSPMTRHLGIDSKPWTSFKLTPSAYLDSMIDIGHVTKAVWMAPQLF